ERSLGDHRRLRRQWRRHRLLGGPDPVHPGALRSLQERHGADHRRHGHRGHPRPAGRRAGGRAARHGDGDAGRRCGLRPRRAAAGPGSASAAGRTRPVRPRRGVGLHGRRHERARRQGREGPRAPADVLAARRLGVRRDGRCGLRRRARGVRDRSARVGGGRVGDPARRPRRLPAPGRSRLGGGRCGRAEVRTPLARGAAARGALLPDHGHRGRDGRLERPLPAPGPRLQRGDGGAGLLVLHRRDDAGPPGRRRDQRPHRPGGAAALGGAADRVPAGRAAAGRSAGRRSGRAVPRRPRRGQRRPADVQRRRAPARHAGGARHRRGVLDGLDGLPRRPSADRVHGRRDLAAVGPGGAHPRGGRRLRAGPPCRRRHGRRRRAGRRAPAASARSGHRPM
ncbi:MAG: Uncharacterized MFS-type transporter, partial [uncultured Solirubrobacteraceae bacterium]